MSFKYKSEDVALVIIISQHELFCISLELKEFKLPYS